MIWRAGRVRKRLGIPHDPPLLTWAVVDHRGLQMPVQPLVPGPRYLALTDQDLWLGGGGSTRRYPLEDVVMASIAPRPAGAMRVDFTSGNPLVIFVADGGTF